MSNKERIKLLFLMLNTGSVRTEEETMAKTVAEMIGEARARIQAVLPKDAADEVAAGKAVFLDVREPVEWEHHIEGAVQVPRGLVEFAADPASPKHRPELDPAGRVIVYCRSGARAALACATLKDMGFENVANLDGGFGAWQEAGLPVNEHHDGI
jgi:rhodanese-related sulfurtransferase